MNNDFRGPQIGWFSNDFHELGSREWKSFANHLTSNPKIVIHSILFPFKCSYVVWNTGKMIKTAATLRGSVGNSIVTSRKQVLWRHFTDCLWNVCKDSIACIFPLSSMWLSLVYDRVRFTTFSSSSVWQSHIQNIPISILWQDVKYPTMEKGGQFQIRC